MKVYKIYRTNDNGVCCAVQVSSVPPGGPSFNYALKHIVHHSPTGFEYGYAGSGPADLALSILADYYKVSKKEDAINGDSGALHNGFKDSFLVNRNPNENFEITEEEITEWLFQRSFGETNDA